VGVFSFLHRKMSPSLQTPHSSVRPLDQKDQERERESVCVCERERVCVREREAQRVCVRERETESVCEGERVCVCV